MGILKSIIIGTITTFLLVNLVFKPFGSASYPVVIFLSLAFIVGCGIFLWIVSK